MKEEFKQFIECQVKAKYWVLMVIGIGLFILGQLSGMAPYKHLAKYAELDKVLGQVAKHHVYDVDNYNCVDFSNKAKEELEKIGIQSTIIAGTPECTENCAGKPNHAVIGILFEPQAGAPLVEKLNKPYIYKKK